jgi:predicted DNA-binding protein (UPF0251 family)
LRKQLHPEDVLRAIDAMIAWAAEHPNTLENGCVNKTKRRKRRRASAERVRPLTSKELEALQIVAEHKGNYTAAAKVVGVSRQVMKRRCDNANAKLGKAAPLKHKTQRLPHDRRGQPII